MDTQAQHFRPACDADIPDIVALVNRAYRDESVCGWTSECELVEGMRTDVSQITQMINSSNTQLICMFTEHRLLGCVQLETRDKETYLGMLTIDPSQQGHGFGTRLLEAAEAYALEELASNMISMRVISQRTELIEFYQRRGYVRSGEVSAYPVNSHVGQPKLEDLTLERLFKTQG
ncbi:MAG: GNAT family N-acetyltransferase [Gammaproteobacteria bacterium]|nr:GNAT family N-acetyltransferase [Gammaproteobacteria bacterium]